MNWSDAQFVLKNQRGQGLIQVIVAAAIMGIIMFSMMTAQIYQIKENKAIAEKLAAIDFQRTITQALSDPAACAAIVARSNLLGSSAVPFDASQITPMPTVVPRLIDTETHLSLRLRSDLFLTYFIHQR